MLDRILTEILQDLTVTENNWAERSNSFWRYKRQENNIFSLASTLFILLELREKTSESQKKIVYVISESIKPLFSLYKNKDGRETYNFYGTCPSQHFPNGYLMQYFDHFRLPDDIDDTALITYSLSPPKADIIKLKTLTETFAQNFKDGSIVYNTWYGKSMPKEQDVCAILNLLYLFHSYELPLTKVDEDSLQFLKKSISLIPTNPFKIARHYANPSLIVYHYARFMSKFSSVLDTEKEQIKRLVYSLLDKEKVFMNRLILETSLIKLGEKREPLNLSTLTTTGFYTFIGAPLAPFSNLFFKYLSKLPWTQMFWSSEIHNKALIAEYLVCQNSLETS